MNDGKFVDDTIVNKLMEKVIFDPNKKNKLIFDGYARAIDQAKNLDLMLSSSNQENRLYFLSKCKKRNNNKKN